MTGPIGPPGETGAPTPNDPDSTLGPSIFFSDYTWPAPGTTVIPPLPRSGGGIIQTVKNGVIEAIQGALQNTSLNITDQAAYVGMEYPMEPLQYPGVWVQFSLTKLDRAGVGHEVTVNIGTDDDPVWAFVQEWIFEGRVTISIAATKSLDRDRLSDSIIAMLGFARPMDMVLMDPTKNTLQDKSLLSILDENPFLAITLQLDTLIPGGQTVTMGTPWKDDILTYEDSYAFDCVGQFNLRFNADGVYTLSEIQPAISMSEGSQPYNPAIWMNQVPQTPYGPNQTPFTGMTNTGNTDIPAM